MVPANLYVQQAKGLDTGRQKADELAPSTSDGEKPQSIPNSTNSVENEVKNMESGKGVVGLLQEGHFKGVADVRLRINFSDELAAIEQGQINNSVSQKIDGILDAVTSTLKSAQLTVTPLDSFIDPFEKAINESKEAFLGAEVQSASTLKAGLESALENLVTSLTQALTLTTTENPQEGNVPIGVETDESSPLSDLLSVLRATFSTAMDDLNKALTGENILPELSEPNGNGVAYDKFLTIYNEMNASREFVDTTSNIDHLDTSA
jgi:hypothetical protein